MKIIIKHTSFILLLLFTCGNLLSQDFTKVTGDPVVSDNRYSEGSSWGDINNDHFLDLFVPDALPGITNLLFINNGNGTFTQVTTGPVVTDISASSGGSFGDYNNDGYPDLFVQNYYGNNNHLYLNTGSGSFTKVTTGSIVNNGGYSFNSSVADYDNDGNLDVFVDNGAFTSGGENNFLYHGNGNGTFTRITSGHIVNDGEKSLSSGWCDYDNDGDIDLFVANGDPFNYTGINNFLYRNNGNGTFTRITTGAIVNDLGASVGVSWGDYDNDGDFDLFAANWGGENSFLYQNNGNGTFTRITTGVVVNDGGHTVAGAWGDCDNDGDLDLFVANDLDQNNCFYLNNGNGTFTKITTGQFVNDGGRSNGATWADYNNDGYLDLFVPNGSNPSQSNFLYRNNASSGNNWVNIKCIGTVSNTSAVGTKLKTKAFINSQPVWQLRQVCGQTGFNAQNSYNVEYGFGNAAVVDSLVIIWTSGTIDVYTNVSINKFYLATEGQGLSEIVLPVNGKGVNLPVKIELCQNYPNPFNPSTKIKFNLPKAGIVKLVVYDILGREIKSLLNNEFLSAGGHTILFSEQNLVSGIYFYRFEVNDGAENILMKKMVYVK